MKPICNCCGNTKTLLRELFYYCPKCKATASITEDNKIYGTFANKKTRELRNKAHKTFDKLWSGDKFNITRSQAYDWLAAELIIDRELCHISYMGDSMLLQVVKACEKRYEVLCRRKTKKYKTIVKEAIKKRYF